MSKNIKILVIGDVKGQFAVLQEKVSLINEKNGPFDLVLCVGDFFGDSESLLDNEEKSELQLIIDKKLKCKCQTNCL